jgi:hypothetical protein
MGHLGAVIVHIYYHHALPGLHILSPCSHLRVRDLIHKTFNRKRIFSKLALSSNRKSNTTFKSPKTHSPMTRRSRVRVTLFSLPLLSSNVTHKMNRTKLVQHNKSHEDDKTKQSMQVQCDTKHGKLKQNA